MTVQHLIGCH